MIVAKIASTLLLFFILIIIIYPKLSNKLRKAIEIIFTVLGILFLIGLLILIWII